MTITWEPRQEHDPSGWWAMKGGRIVGEVAWYDDGGIYWAAFIRPERLPGRFASAAEAKAAVEAAAARP